MKNLFRIGVFSLMILLSSFAPKAEKTITNNTKTNCESTLVNNTLNKQKFPITIQIQSGQYYVEGCWISFSATITFEWDGNPDHSFEQTIVSDATWYVSCEPTGVYVRGTVSDPAFEVVGQQINNITFASSTDEKITKLTQDLEFIKELKDITNDEITRTVL